MTLDQMIREVQAACPELGKPDGRPGPATWGAIHRRIAGASLAVLKASAAAGLRPAPIIHGAVDARSEKAIATLHLKVQPYARALIHAATERGWDFKITSGLRTYAEQDALYSQSRTNPPPGPRVTGARGGYSNHNFGLAFDVTLFSGAKPVWDSPLYKALAPLAIALGLEWGGNWKSIQDEPHYQLRPRWAEGMSEPVMLAELRRRRAAGIDVYA